MPTVGSLAWQLIADNTRFAAGTGMARKNLRGLHGDLTKLRGPMGSMSMAAATLTSSVGALAAVLAGVAAAGAAAFAKEGIRMAASLEQLNVQMEVMTGSKATGGALMQQMIALAKETPFSLEDVATSGKVLLAMGSSAGEVTRQVKMLGDVSAATGQPVAQLAQVFGEVQNAGRLTSNELRQFNMRGIPLLSELSEMLGVSKVELREMTEAGEISADMVEAAFERMTAAGGRFADMMGRQAETLTGKWEKFTDALSLAAAASIGDPGTSGTAGGFLSKSLEEATTGVERAGSFFEMFQAKGFGAFTEKGRQDFMFDKMNKELQDKLRLENAQANPTIEPDEAAIAQEKLNEKMGEFINKLQMQVDTYGMASEAADLYEMKMRGATKADIEAAQALIDQKTKLDESKKAKEEADRLEEKRASDFMSLIESSKTEAQKFGDEFHRIMSFLDLREGSNNSFAVAGLLENLRDRVAKGLGDDGPVNAQSTAAIRAGSIEALRAQFSGGVAQKQLKEAEKQTRELEAMRGVMESIDGKLITLAEAPG